MINKKDFEKIQKQIESFDSVRDKIIKKSRDVIKLSKQVIYAVHRDDLLGAAKHIISMKKELKELHLFAKKHPALYYSGSIRVAEQEFVEALTFYDFVKNGKVPSIKQFDVQPDNYLMGLCDLTGELVRKAINSAIKERFGESIRMKNCVSDLYDELMKFDFRGGELRRKFDSIKYDLKKLEDLALELKLKGKI